MGYVMHGAMTRMCVNNRCDECPLSGRDHHTDMPTKTNKACDCPCHGRHEGGVHTDIDMN